MSVEQELTKILGEPVQPDGKIDMDYVGKTYARAIVERAVNQALTGGDAVGTARILKMMHEVGRVKVEINNAIGEIIDRVLCETVPADVAQRVMDRIAEEIDSAGII